MAKGPPKSCRKKNCIAGLLMMMWLVLLCPAAPICVTTWDLQPSAIAATNGWSNKFRQSLVQEAADTLKKLHPDVILLQQATDWETCHQLAQALRPETYYVTVCSSFRDPRTSRPTRQVAILSKARAWMAGSQPWQNSGESPAAPGGFAFAVMRLGDENVGIFSAQLGDGAAFQQAGDDSARQLVTQIAFLQNWSTNRLQAFIVAGDFNTTPDVLPLVHEKTLMRLEHIGFENAFAGQPLRNVRQSTAILDYIFARDASLAAPPVTMPSVLSEQAAVTCELDLTAPQAAPAPLPLTAQVELSPERLAANLANRLPASTMRAHKITKRVGGHRTLWWLAGCLAGGVIIVLVRKLSRRSESQPAPASVIREPRSKSPPYVQVETGGSTRTQSRTWQPRPDEAVRAGVIASLSRWLKEKVVQRLVSDRAQLLATQQAAALKVQAVDERLRKVEHHIQQRNQEYEQRIDDLLEALITAREENRELIRAQIALLKAEMEKARRKADQQNEEPQRF